MASLALLFAYGQGGYFYNTGNGVALHADSDGVAVLADGNGVIQSTAKSYLWIGGNGVRPYRQSDSTIIDMDTVGKHKNISRRNRREQERHAPHRHPGAALRAERDDLRYGYLLGGRHGP